MKRYIVIHSINIEPDTPVLAATFDNISDAEKYAIGITTVTGRICSICKVITTTELNITFNDVV